jgi:hypothetical protein
MDGLRMATLLPELSSAVCPPRATPHLAERTGHVAITRVRTLPAREFAQIHQSLAQPLCIKVSV